MNVVDPFTRNGYRSKGVATVHVGHVYDSGASEREVRGRRRHYVDQLNSGPRRFTIASTFCAPRTFSQPAAIVAIAVATSNKTSPGRTGSTRALPEARAA